MTLTQARLQELLDYDPLTGIFTRKVAGGGVRAGTRTGYLHKGAGHILISVGGKQHYADRLAWLYMTGIWPTFIINHVNGELTDNRIANLKPLTSPSQAS